MIIQVIQNYPEVEMEAASVIGLSAMGLSQDLPPHLTKLNDMLIKIIFEIEHFNANPDLISKEQELQFYNSAHKVFTLLTKFSKALGKDDLSDNFFDMNLKKAINSIRNLKIALLARIEGDMLECAQLSSQSAAKKSLNDFDNV